MKKIWISTSALALLLAGCGGEKENNTQTDKKASTCVERDIEIPCDLKDRIQTFREDLNSLPHFATDSLDLNKIEGQFEKAIANNAATIKDIQGNAQLLEKLAALVEGYENIISGRDSVLLKKEVMDQLEIGSKNNHSMVTLSSGKQKHPTFYLKNKSKKYFHTATIEFDLLSRDRKSIRKITQVVNTNGFEPAAFGAVFPPYFNGENKSLPIFELLSEDEIKAWDSTAVRLLNIS
jgi:hypothetical protein